MGDVKFLLDENDGTLKTWSADNPVKGVMPHAVDPDSADRLWALSEEITGVSA